jgi:hypothetical protein
MCGPVGVGTKSEKIWPWQAKMVRLIEPATLKEIEMFLLDLGGGNHEDNMNALRGFPRYFLVELSEVDFFSLVFLQNNHVLPICPRGADRSLRSVAERALKIDSPHLHVNWNLAEVIRQTQEHLVADMPIRPLVLRDARQSELQYGQFYIQDGCHTALGYAMVILSDNSSYFPPHAYLATRHELP